MAREPTVALRFTGVQRAASAGPLPPFPPTLSFIGYTARQIGLVLLRKMLQYVILFDMKEKIFCSRTFFLIVVCLVVVLPVVAQGAGAGALAYPESYFSFRDAMLNGRGKSAPEFESQYATVVAEVEASKSGWERDVLLAGCDYVLGRAYRYLGDTKKAIMYFDKAIEICKEVLKKHEVAEAYVVYADAISQNCSIKPKTYAMTQGAKIKTLAKKALELDPSYEYDVYSALSARAYGYLQQGQKEDALYWYQKALELYPDNVAVLEIIPTIK